MNDFYLHYVLIPNIQTFFLAITIIIAFAFCVVTVMYIVATIQCDPDYEEDMLTVSKLKKINFYILLPILLVSSVASITIPTRNDYMTMLGIGNVIEYVEKNEDIKELPDNVVQAINVWTEKYVEENK